MDDYILRIAETLKMARNKSGLSQAALAKRMGVSKRTVIKWEQGVNAISCSMLVKWFVCCGVAVKRYIDACLHPGLLEHLEDDQIAADKRRIMHGLVDEMSNYEIDGWLYLYYGDHGSDPLGVLTETLANMHTPLRDRVAIVNAVIGHYNMAQSNDDDPDPNGIQPIMDIVMQARDCGEEAARRGNDAYSVNTEGKNG